MSQFKFDSKETFLIRDDGCDIIIKNEGNKHFLIITHPFRRIELQISKTTLTNLKKDAIKWGCFDE